MGWISIFRKDIREHSLALFGLAIGLILVVLLSQSQLRAGEFSMSNFEVVRFALITVIPLIALIIGNRLIVREYTGGTRSFVESLPITPATPLLVKFLSGWIYLLLLGVVLVAIAASLADAAEFIDQRYVLILTVKTSAIITLYWCIVFFTSLTGKLRLLIYVTFGLALLWLISMPSFDATRLAPIALMDQQQFIFERDTFPWRDLLETMLIAVLIVIAAFVLALFNDGSVAEQLGKPLSKRNMVAIVILGATIYGVYAELQEKWDTTEQEFTGTYVLRHDYLPIEISYLAAPYQQQAQASLNDLQAMLELFQADTGINTLPRIQITLNTDLERVEVYPEYSEGVIVAANFTEYNFYEHRMVSNIALHHLMLLLTNSRWDYETRHWLLDGLARWWAEGAENALASPNNPEHFARSLIAQRRFTADINPLLAWQTVTDKFGFEATGAMAYTALLYLAEIKGSDTVVKLANSYLYEHPPTSSVESFKTLLNPDTSRFKEITGMEFQQFTDDWQQWLSRQADDPQVEELLSLVPAITGNIASVKDARGLYWLEGRYQPMPGYIAGTTGNCTLRHQPASVFIRETDIYERERDRQPCSINSIAHKVESPYGAGDRTYAVLEFEHERFARPIPLWTGRLTIQ